jgi:hypothetical protein
VRSKWYEASLFSNDYDIVTITETKLDVLATDSSIDIDAFVHSRQDRNSNGGGVITYIKKSLQPVPLFDHQHRAAELGLEVTLTAISFGRGNSAIVVGVYRPPSAKVAWFETFNELYGTSRSWID